MTFLLDGLKSRLQLTASRGQPLPLILLYFFFIVFVSFIYCIVFVVINTSSVVAIFYHVFITVNKLTPTNTIKLTVMVVLAMRSIEDATLGHPKGRSSK